MPARDVQFVQGQYYHVFNRGINRQSIFRDDDDFIAFLTRIKKHCIRFKIVVIAYCLMPNHFHFLMRQDGEIPVRKAIELTGNGYVQHYNHRHKRTGTLFEGRFKALLVDDDEYIHHLCRYIHGNPVKDGFALRPELWSYSNYQEWCGTRNGTLVDRTFITDHFGTPSRYTEYLYDYLQNRAKLPTTLAAYLSSLME
ncbi:MAG: transposase [Caldilineaceae bacterium]